MEAKRPRLAFSLQKKQGNVCKAFVVEDEEVEGEELPKAAVKEIKDEDFTQQLRSSCEAFERYRRSLGARHGALFRRFAALLNGERGISGSVGGASSSLLTATVSAMVQLADFRMDGTDAREDASVVTAALELFEVLCSAVQELPQDLPPEAFMDGLRQRWRLGDTSSEDEWGSYAARAAELFRLKDTVSSLYAWGMLPRSTASRLLQRMKSEMGCEAHILDPIAGTGLHGVLFKDLGAEVTLADSVHGGSTQSSGADTQYLQQCISSGSSARAAAAAATAAANAAVAAAGPAVVWAKLEHLDVFDDGQVADAWWARHGKASNCVLMLSFPPPPPSEVAEAALKRFEGQWLLFIGEWRGCTGATGFFNLLEAEWMVIQTFEVPRWPMMEDKAFFLRRIGRSGPNAEGKDCMHLECSMPALIRGAL